jgi:hypothetical protein
VPLVEGGQRVRELAVVAGRILRLAGDRLEPVQKCFPRAGCGEVVLLFVEGRDQLAAELDANLFFFERLRSDGPADVRMIDSSLD